MGLPWRNAHHHATRSRNFSRCTRVVLTLLCLIVVLFLSNLDVFISHQTKRPIAVGRQNLEYTSTNYSKKETRGTFDENFIVTWGDQRAKILNNGELLTCSLDNITGSGFQSRKKYLFGKIDMELKLVPGNSAGTVTTYYFSSEGSKHDEIDFEFLGNISGEPYTLHTNVYTQGKGNKEQQFFMWFDPTADFHTYSLIWNPKRIIFYVDGTPIREFKNGEKYGIPFPKQQPMRIYASLWNADDWATQGGRVKTDWSLAPFYASFRNFTADACTVNFLGESSCTNTNTNTSASSNYKKNNDTNDVDQLLLQPKWFTQKLDSLGRKKLKWVQKNYMIYNYCTDTNRFPKIPPECKYS